MTDISIETTPSRGAMPRRVDPRGDWSDERVELLKRLWTDGLSASQIAAELGYVTRNAVIGKIHRLGLSGRARQPRGSSEGRSRRSYKPRSVVPRDAMRVDRMLNGQPEFEPESEPEVILEEAIPVGQRKTIWELEAGMCKWPCGDPASPDFYFCAGPAIKDMPYCTGHSRISYMPPKQRRDKQKPSWRQAA